MLVRLCSKSFKLGRLQQYMNGDLQIYKLGLEKAEDHIASIRWIVEKAREFQKNICFLNYMKVFDCIDHKKLENS